MNSNEALLRKLLSSGSTPGISYAFFDADAIRFRYMGGMSDVLRGKQIDEQTRFNGYSITKTFTAVAILQLEALGLVRLDDQVMRYLPQFSYGKTATIRHLLTHTSGIPNPIPLKWIHLIDEHDTFDRHEFFQAVFARHSKAKSPAGARFSYSNLGYVLLGDIIEHVSGERYEDYVTKYILEKVAEPGALSFTIDPIHHAKGYQKRFSLMNMILGCFLDKDKFMGPAEGVWKPFRPTYINGTPYGGLMVNAPGLVAYGQALLRNDELIPEESKARLFMEHHTPDGKATGMCLAWFTGVLQGRRFYTHAGGGGGFYVELRLYPEQACGSVVLLNRSGMKDERLLDQLDAPFIS